jgi:putative ATPase
MKRPASAVSRIATRQEHNEHRKAMSLFGGVPQLDVRPGATASAAPLAERMRPRALDEFVGQEHLLAPGKPLRVQIESDDASSMILWGPPGVGKTTLAKIIAERVRASFIEFSAVMAGIKEIKQVMVDAEKASAYGSNTILFIDEIHRFNKAQQDAFLPYVERGTIRLIGATTENPSFEIIAALLSRCRVYTLRPLTENQLITLLQRALNDPERGLGALHLDADDDALGMIASYSSGDARNACNALEMAAKLATAQPHSATGANTVTNPRITREIAQEALQQRVLLYDKTGEEHYNLISALHKSVRNSDADASLYWLGRMIQAGEDTMYIARRVVRMAVEDIGLASPEALNLTLSARDAVHFLGSPEGDLALAQAVVYLALAPKSNALYTAYGAVLADIESTRAEPVPLHLRNAPTGLMKALDYGKGYQYAHDEEGRVADMECLPESLSNRHYYNPTSQGREKLLAQRMEEIRKLRESNRTATKRKVASRKPETSGPA